MADIPTMSHIRGKRILILDDHRNIRLALAMTLESEGAKIVQAEGYTDGLLKIGKIPPRTADGSDETSKSAFPFDILLLDIRLPDGSGLDILRLLSTTGWASRVIMISGEGTTSDAFDATRLGAFDYIEKPFVPERILVSVDRCLAFNQIQTAHQTLEKKLRKGHEILGSSEKIKALMAMIRRVAPTNGRVLVTGESGTGKELVSREIHRCSNRSHKELVKVNCAAIPINLIESELFGHEKGSFTGAIKSRKGLFERADGGTLFLDEIGELDLNVQAKLLRVLQSGEMVRVGAEKNITVDVRVIGATNRDLAEMVSAGTFREDLYYRLNVVTLYVPPLRERVDDIGELATTFLQEACEEHSLGDRSFTASAIEQLRLHSWPGNIRELKNFVERIAILSDYSQISDLADLRSSVSKSEHRSLVEPPAKSSSGAEADTKNLDFMFSCGQTPWQDFQQRAGKAFIKFTLQQTGGNVSEAARVLCLERAYLHRLMKKLGVQRGVIVSDE